MLGLLFALCSCISRQDIYAGGMFNNYMTPNSKWTTIQKKEFMKKAILIKQGFTNYEYTLPMLKGRSIMKMQSMAISIKPKMNTLHFSLLQESIDRYERVIGRKC
jgi:hypothetical protein